MAVPSRRGSNQYRIVRRPVPKPQIDPEDRLLAQIRQDLKITPAGVKVNPVRKMVSNTQAAAHLGWTIFTFIRPHLASRLPQTLEQLSQHPSSLVRYMTAHSNKLPQPVQARLAQDRDPAVRTELARNADINPAVLSVLASDDDQMVRRAVVGNPATPAGALELLSADPDPVVAAAASIHPNNPIRLT
jgi:hypothetical protein